MKVLLFVVVALCMGALLPADAIPPSLKRKEHSYVVKNLQTPDADTAAKTIRSALPMPNRRIPPVEGAKVVKNQGRIINGSAAEDCQFPHQVAIINNIPDEGQYFCGGSIIDSKWILTAAHCIHEDASWILVLAGSIVWYDAPSWIYARRAIIHAAYDDYWLRNDIALIELQANLPLGDCLKAVELEPDGCDDSLIGERVTASGWGLTSDNSNAIEDTLRWTTAKIISNDDLRAYYGNTVIDTTLGTISCDSNGTICSGDSGGPLLLKKTGHQVGINSFVSIYGCESNAPNGYARVPCFIDWIEEAKTQ